MTSRYCLAITLTSSLFASAVHAELTEESCTAIADLVYPDLRIEQADFVTGEIAMISEKPYPDHCVITGFLEERVGTDGQNYATGFELRLPVDWNERFFFQGGGGIDGSVRPAIGTNTGGMPDALTLGAWTIHETQNPFTRPFVRSGFREGAEYRLYFRLNEIRYGRRECGRIW
ncbi:MAG: tannase/feruloyl esterase family alpha/beta hydrolase [Granulosicoccus sp.]